MGFASSFVVLRMGGRTVTIRGRKPTTQNRLVRSTSTSCIRRRLRYSGPSILLQEWVGSKEDFSPRNYLVKPRSVGLFQLSSPRSATVRQPSVALPSSSFPSRPRRVPLLSTQFGAQRRDVDLHVDVELAQVLRLDFPPV